MSPKVRQPAVRVYLDSQDVSRFSNRRELDKSPTVRSTLKSLRQLAANGIAEFRFSAAHVLEAAPTNIGAMQWAQQRATFMRGLFGSRALYFPDKLRRMEIKAIVADGVDVAVAHSRHKYSSNNGGDWFPDISDIGQSLMAVTQREIASQLQGLPLSQDKHKAIASQIFDGDKLSLAFRAGLAANLQDIVQISALPVSPKFLATYRKWLLGNASGDQVVAELVRTFSDIGHFMTWLVTPGVDATTLVGAFRKPGSDLIARVVKFRGEINEAPERIPEGGVMKGLEVSGVKIGGPEKSEAARKILAHQSIAMGSQAKIKCRQDLYLEHEKWLSDNGVTSQMFDDWHTTDPAFPSVDAYIDLSMANGLINVSHTRKSDSIPSDWGDMLHGLYIPYVDIMRVDRFAMQYMRATAENYGCTLVDDLPALPDIVLQRAASSK